MEASLRLALTAYVDSLMASLMAPLVPRPVGLERLKQTESSGPCAVGPLPAVKTVVRKTLVSEQCCLHQL